MMNVRIADLKDFEKIMKIYKYAQDYMIQSRNPTQWGHFYPDEELIRSDIHQECLQGNIRRKWDTWGMCTV